MSEFHDGLDRRKFLKAAGAVGVGSILAATAAKAAVQGPAPAVTPTPAPAAGDQVPRRKLGKTGVEIPVIGLGNGLFSIEENMDVLPRCLQWGVTYWDTAASYRGGEAGIGKYFAQNPGLRPKIFLVTKSADIATPLPVVADIEKQFQESLKRLKTDYIDLYIGVHAMPDIKMLTDDMRAWAGEKKKKGQIKFFGFSAHANMGRTLLAAAKLDWIDACLVRADFRVIREPEMAAGLDACTKAGIGIISIKAMSVGMNPSAAEDKKLTFNFTDKGFDAYQAKLKALLEDKRFASAAVGMKSAAIIDSCAAAALDKTKLTDAHWRALDEYAAATGDNFCAAAPHLRRRPFGRLQACPEPVEGAGPARRRRCRRHHALPDVRQLLRRRGPRTVSLLPHPRRRAPPPPRRRLFPRGGPLPPAHRHRPPGRRGVQDAGVRRASGVKNPCSFVLLVFYLDTRGGGGGYDTI